MKTKKIIVAGILVKEAVYPRGSRYDTPRQRAAKRKLSSEAQKRMNAKYRKEKLELELAANFMPGDLWVTLTFRDADLPADEKSVDAKMKAFLRRFRQAKRRARPVVCWRAEHKHWHEDPRMDVRWHVHCCITATGDDYDAIRRAWPYGDVVEIKPIRIDKENSYAALAEYMIKEPLDRAGAHAWHITRNAKKPEVESFPVEDDTPLHAPKGAIVYEDARDSNCFGSWHYVKYVRTAAVKASRKQRPKPKRRR